MPNKPLVSIITITYNQERFIRQCIESALNQTYPNWEQIIIDDESKDKTPDIIAEYHDPRIHYIKQQNVGIWRTGESWNKGLRLSQGELIAHLDGDDCWPLDKLERQIDVFQNPNIVLSWGKCGWIDGEGRKSTTRTRRLRRSGVRRNSSSCSRWMANTTDGRSRSILDSLRLRPPSFGLTRPLVS